MPSRVSASGSYSTRCVPAYPVRGSRSAQSIPSVVAVNQVVGYAAATFTTTVSDGRLTKTSTFTINVMPPSTLGITASFLMGSRAPGTPGNVTTAIPVMSTNTSKPVVPTRQEYIEFTLRGLQGDVTRDDLRLYVNDRLMSLRSTTLVKVSESGGSVTYRLLGLGNVSSARARYVFTVGGAAGWFAASWDRR